MVQVDVDDAFLITESFSNPLDVIGFLLEEFGFPALPPLCGFFSKKKSLSHDDLRIAPSFFILIGAYRPLGLVGA